MKEAFNKDDLDINDLSQYLAIAILALSVIGQSMLIGQQRNTINSNQDKIDGLYSALQSDNQTEPRTQSANNSNELENYTGPTIEISSPRIEFDPDNSEPDYGVSDEFREKAIKEALVQ